MRPAHSSSFVSVEYSLNAVQYKLLLRKPSSVCLCLCMCAWFLLYVYNKMLAGNSHWALWHYKMQAQGLRSPILAGDVKKHQVVSRCDRNKLIPHETPQRPWQILETDLLSWHRHVFLIVTDYSRLGSGTTTIHKGNHCDSIHSVYSGQTWDSR